MFKPDPRSSSSDASRNPTAAPPRSNNAPSNSFTSRLMSLFELQQQHLSNKQLTSTTPNSTQTAKMVYTLVVHLYAKDDAESKLVAKLQEASQVYSNDKETLGW
jgi:hypothetical protein